MPKKYVFIPFDRYLSKETEAWCKAKNLEWKTVKGLTPKHAGTNQSLATVKEGATIYIQAEGYTNNLTGIGGDRGRPFITAAQLVGILTAAGLAPGTNNLKIKVWACFSGFHFAQAFHAAANGIYPNLTVDGYMGKTRLAESKVVLGATEHGGQIDPDGYDEEDSLAPDQRVRFP